jgi:hypothetical protein
MTLASMLSVVAASALLGGCSSGGSTAKTDVRHIRSNLTPGLQTSAQRHHEVNNSLAIMSNQHHRLMHEDLGRVLLYIDRPSRLTPAPVAH